LKPKTKTMYKKFLLVTASAFLTVTISQAQVKTNATIVTKTIIESEEGDTPPPPPPPGAEGGNRMFVRFGGDGETKYTTYVKNGMVKTVTESESINSTTIRDNDKKTTINLMTLQGQTNGTITTDAQREEQAKKIDSLMKANGRNIGNRPEANSPSVVVVLKPETKKIAGIVCNRAILAVTRRNTTDSNEVWYAPGIKINNVPSTGNPVAAFGGLSFGNRNIGGVLGLDKIDGFMMAYSGSQGRGRTIKIEVTKIDFDKEIKDKEFEVPKGITVKPFDASNFTGGNGTQQIRIVQ
jgi:hypothetical protein